MTDFMVFYPNVLENYYCSVCVFVAIAAELTEKEGEVPGKKALPWVTDTLNCKR